MTPYRDMDEDERLTFLYDAIGAVTLMDRLDLDPRLKPAMFAVWAMATTTTSMHNLQTFYEIDRDACLSEAVHSGLTFFANLSATADDLPKVDGEDRQLVRDALYHVRAITDRLNDPHYRPAIALVLERLFEDTVKKGLR